MSRSDRVPQSVPQSGRLHVDESPFDLERMRRRFPRWMQRFMPSGGGTHEDYHGKGMFGVTVFLLSESIVFLSLFFAYIVLRLTTPDWIPPGITGPERSPFVIFNTIVLLSSSVVIQLAERSLSRHHLKRFRILWLVTMAMGTYFLIGQGIEWHNLDFGLRAGLMGATFYILTGFHGLHVLSGVLLQGVILTRSLVPGNFSHGHFGASATTLFWHFVDGVWVILFSLIYLWQAQS